MQRRPGLTLIEVLIYTAFVGMIMVSMALLASTAFTVRGKLRDALVLEQNIRSSLNRISFLVSEASGITTPPLGSASGILVLTMPTGAQSPTTITTTSGTIMLTQGATGTAQALTSNEVSISTLTLTRVSSTNPVVRIVVTGGMRNAASTYETLTVTTTASVRR